METFDLSSLAESGISVMLAAVVIYWYRSDSKERIESANQRTIKAEKMAEREREDKVMIVEALQSNTRALTNLEAAITMQNVHSDREEERAVQREERRMGGR